jgi:restriction system protein
MARQKSSLFEDIVMVASKLPWWICIVLALISYFILHAIASRPIMPATVAPGQMGDAVTRGLLTTLAFFGQIVLPFAFGLGALISGINSIRQKKLYNTVAARRGVGALNEMSWEDFERLVSEYYRRQGFQVSREGGNGPDGGIDLVLRQKSETYLVQCKQWKAYKVGVQPVREFYGVMASKGAAGGYFVTSGEFTEEAKSFVQGLNLELIDGKKLRQMIDNVQQSKSPASGKDLKVDHEIFPGQSALSTAISPVAPACPKCGAGMIKRIAGKGENLGKEFWGCSTYPKCKGIIPVASDPNNAPTKTEEQSVDAEAATSQKTCPQCGGGLVVRKFKSGPRVGEQFYGCIPCKKGWPVEQAV